MGAMDPDPRADVSQVVRSFALARRRWFGVAYTNEVDWNSAWIEYGHAGDRLRAELVRRGGQMLVGGIIYSLDHRGCIAIEQAVDQRDEETLAAIKADLTARKGGASCQSSSSS